MTTKTNKSSKKTMDKTVEMTIVDFVPYYTKKEIDDMFAVFADALIEKEIEQPVEGVKLSTWQRFKNWLHKK